MNTKVGRNDPCPCGSGKKYKHCHGAPQAQPAPTDDSHEGAIERVMAWIGQTHRKAFVEAMREAIEEAAIACFDDDEDAGLDALEDVSEELWRQLQINFSEWLIAEGDILHRGRRERLSELLLARGGPLLSAGQRDWIEQLARQSLRLYDVTEVRPGEGLVLCDAIDPELAPVFVVELEGSRTLRVGEPIGARVLRAGGEHMMSGALYPFGAAAGRALTQHLREIAAREQHEEDRALMIGLALAEAWLAQYLLPPELPRFVDAGSGDALQMTTDHYEVRDWAALDAALRAQPDVEAAAAGGFVRLAEAGDGPRRVLASVNPHADRGKLGVFYRTARLADEGRAWFDALAGDAVRFRLREVSDPLALLRSGTAAGGSAAAPALPEGIAPEALADAIAGVIRRSYANWADEPIPALDGQTPRQAVATPAGLERVKGLLRSYEDGEADAAQRQGRSAVSYQFLWDALELKR